MKKVLVIACLIFFSISFVSAVWWNPVDWFSEPRLSPSLVPQCDSNNTGIEIQFESPSAGDIFDVGDIVNLRVGVSHDRDDLEFDIRTYLYEVDSSGNHYLLSFDSVDNAVEVDEEDTEWEIFEHQLTGVMNRNNDFKIFVLVEEDDDFCNTAFLDVNVLGSVVSSPVIVPTVESSPVVDSRVADSDVPEETVPEFIHLQTSNVEMTSDFGTTFTYISSDGSEKTGTTSEGDFSKASCGVFSGVPGDADGDGVANAIDVQLVINGALGIGTCEGADVNDDGNVNSVDVQLTINAVLGIIPLKLLILTTENSFNINEQILLTSLSEVSLSPSVSETKDKTIGGILKKMFKRFYNLFASLFVNEDIQYSPEIDSQSVSKLNFDLHRLSLGGSKIEGALVSKAIERKEKMLQLAENNPGAFLTYTISQEQRDTVFKNIAPYLEKQVTREGVLGVFETPHLGIEGDRGIEAFVYSLSIGDKTYNLKFADGSQPKAIGGDRVRVNGVELEDYLITSSAQTGAFEVIDEGKSASGRMDENFGVQKVAIILTKATGTEDPEIDYDLIETHMEKTNEYYREVSYGQVSLEWDLYDWREVANGRPHPIYGVQIYSQDALGVDFSKYSRVISIDNRNCRGGLGCGDVGVTCYDSPGCDVEYSTFYVNATVFQEDNLYVALVHELGHNFGIYHANLLVCDAPLYIGGVNDCISEEYADYFDVMGYNIYNYLMGHFSTLHKLMLTWIDDSDTIIVESSGTYTISALEVEARGPKISLEIPRKIDEDGNVHSFYYVEYRAPIGQDSFITETQIDNGPQVRIAGFVKGDGGGWRCSFSRYDSRC